MIDDATVEIYMVVEDVVTEDEDGRGIINSFAGSYHGKSIATNLTVIDGGNIDSEICVTIYNNYLGKLIVYKNYQKDFNIVCNSNAYELILQTKTVIQYSILQKNTFLKKVFFILIFIIQNNLCNLCSKFFQFLILIKRSV